MSAAWALALAAAADPAPICTDRPAKANAVCTVPPGEFQVESSAIGWAQSGDGGTRTTLLYVGSSVMKYGVDRRSDLQLGFTPYLRFKNREAGRQEVISGIGDLTIRYKYRLTDGERPVQVAIIPFIKVPTAKRGMGNRRVEGGLAFPISFTLSGPVALTLGPEVDVLADGDGAGRHAALINLVNLAATVVPRLTIAGELWSNINFDPAGTARQASADAAVAYALSDRVQIDGGVNAGLTRHTPDIEFYAGFSFKL